MSIPSRRKHLSAFRSDRFRGGCAASNAACCPRTISGCSNARNTVSVPNGRGSFIRIAKGRKATSPPRMPTRFPPASCWPAGTAISTISRGTISFINGPSECKGTLRFYESGASLQTENLWVKCDECCASRNLAQAFGRAGQDNLPRCRGRHPHLDQYDTGCKEQARAVLLGATNSWFPITLSALAIPLDQRPCSQLVQDGWDYFADLESEAEVAVTMKTLKKTGALPGIDKHSPKAIWEVIQSIKTGAATTGVTEADIKGSGMGCVDRSEPADRLAAFSEQAGAPPKGFEKQIAGVLLLERLREVNALLGFTRVEAPEETANPDERAPRADLCKGAPTWVPATEVHGEGIFIRFDEDAICEWEARARYKARNAKLLAGHRGWRNAQKTRSHRGYPGIRYAMLHTLSHLLIRELALECGYNAASIRERIYADIEGEQPQAGILIYTAAADSDGTLGGLVDLGQPDKSRTTSQTGARSRRDMFVRPALLRAQSRGRSFAPCRRVSRLFFRLGNIV